MHYFIFHHSLFWKIKFFTKQSNTSFPLKNMIRNAVSVHSPESHCSLHRFAGSLSAVSVNLMANSLQTHGDSNATTRRLCYESKNVWSGWIHSECVETPSQMRWDSTANALKLIANAPRFRWGCAEAQKTVKRCSICCRVRVKDSKVRERLKMEQKGHKL